MVATGVTTAVAIQFVIKYLEDAAILAARAEMEKLIISSLFQQNAQQNVQAEPSNYGTNITK